MRRFRIGVDVGGTCTDTVVIDSAGGATVGKAFSTPEDFSEGIVDSLGTAAAALDMSTGDLLSRTELFFHSTTIAENAIVDRSMSEAGLVVTGGFEDTLRISRGGYGRYSGLSEEAVKNIVDSDKPPELVPRRMIRGIKERTDVRGSVLAEPDPIEVREAIQELVAAGAESLGICLLGSFANGANEAMVRKLAADVAPGTFVTTGSEIAAIEGEYERMSTVALNARLGPVVRGYLGRLMERLGELLFSGTVLVMQAHGGLVSPEEASARAVGMIESGPIGGLVGSREMGNLMGYDRILAADMGGTTFKSGHITDGRIEHEREPMAIRYHHALQKLETVSVPLAGGSIVTLDYRSGLPKIGPQSAGSQPGPVCYGLGGEEPTLTDVDLLLGFLDSSFFLGGSVELEEQGALDLFKAKIAEPLGLDVSVAAGGIYDLANSIIFDLLHAQTIERGIDLRDYSLFVSGGTAGMHLPRVARDLGVKAVVVPHSASVHGAFGVANAQIVYSDVLSRQLHLPVDASEVNDAFSVVEKRVLERIGASGLETNDTDVYRYVSLRYGRQVHVVTVPVESQGPVDEGELEDLVDRFHSAYAERYGADAGYRAAGVELVSFAVRGVVPGDRPRAAPEDLGDPDPSSAVLGRREAYFGEMREADCYAFTEMRPGNEVHGPAIISTPITTIVVQPDQLATCDEHRNLVITW